MVRILGIVNTFTCSPSSLSAAPSSPSQLPGIALGIAEEQRCHFKSQAPGSRKTQTDRILGTVGFSPPTPKALNVKKPLHLPESRTPGGFVEPEAQLLEWHCKSYATPHPQPHRFKCDIEISEISNNDSGNPLRSSRRREGGCGRVNLVKESADLLKLHLNIVLFPASQPQEHTENIQLKGGENPAIKSSFIFLKVTIPVTHNTLSIPMSSLAPISAIQLERSNSHIPNRTSCKRHAV